MLHFNPQTGLFADEIEDVRASVRQDWITAFARNGYPALNTEPETPQGQLIDSQTAAIVDKDGELLFLANQFNPLTAQGIWQDALGKIYFLTRKTAQRSEAVAVCTGLGGTVIPQGALVKSIMDNSVWEVAQNVTIPQSGTVEARLISQTTGAVGASANTLTKIATVTPGWDEVTNPAAAVLGRDIETQIEFEMRRYASVAKNARGSVLALYGALSDLDGVIDCAVLENDTSQPVVKWGVEIPAHSVYISIVGGDDTDIAATIYGKKDCGCGTAGNTEVTYQDTQLPGVPIYTYRIERPMQTRFGIRVKIRLINGTPGNIVALLKEALTAEFNGLGTHCNLRVGMAQNVVSSRFYCAGVEAGGIGIEDIDLAFPVTDNAEPTYTDIVTVNANQEPTLSASDIVIVDENGEPLE